MIKHLNIILEEKDYNKVIKAKKTAGFENWTKFLLYLVDLHDKSQTKTKDNKT